MFILDNFYSAVPKSTDVFSPVIHNILLRPSIGYLFQLFFFTVIEFSFLVVSIPLLKSFLLSHYDHIFLYLFEYEYIFL